MQAKSEEIFFIQGAELETLPVRPMRTGLFGKTLEDALQTLIEKYPRLLPGKQMDPGNEDPPRFVLLCRETSIGGWSLDHLLVDQRAVLTLVEAKLTENPEARRSVIGQIIEYAAHAEEYWRNGRAREKAVEFHSKNGREIDQILLEEFGVEAEGFWSDVEEKLRRGKIRLIIAADEIRPEVRRVIEYLNGEMKNAEVYGLELRCFGNESGPLVLVPHLIGQTQAIIDSKVSRPSTKWTVERLREALDEQPDSVVGQRFRRILDWALERGVFRGDSKASGPAFWLLGTMGLPLFDFSGPGQVYCRLQENRYAGGTEERARLVADLKDLGMLDRELNVDDVKDGRYLKRSVADVSEGEFEKMLDIFSRFCGAPNLRTP